MKSVNLVPYCPLPVDSGGKSEMWKHLEILKGLGECKIISAATKPVGAGWSAEERSLIESQGYKVELREASSGRNVYQSYGIAYASVCKGLGLERAFGHSNPYHHSAFPQDWFARMTDDADIACINYSYWADLKCNCPKAVILLDLWSDYMWEGMDKEVEDLGTADLVVVISKEEEIKLNSMGVAKTLWSPPAVKSVDLQLTDSVGLLGSANKFNVEGLRWLEKASTDLQINVYGDVSRCVSGKNFRQMGRYADALQPYKDCGIILLPTSGGMGVQIKVIESLAYGRAIVARKGAMRGLPPGQGAWIEVDRPEEMVEAALALQSDGEAKRQLTCKARHYYASYLDSEEIKNKLMSAYHNLGKKP